MYLNPKEVELKDAKGFANGTRLSIASKADTMSGGDTGEVVEKRGKTEVRCKNDAHVQTSVIPGDH